MEKEGECGGKWKLLFCGHTIIYWPLLSINRMMHCVCFLFIYSTELGNNRSSAVAAAAEMLEFYIDFHIMYMHRKTLPLKNRFKKLLLGSIRISLAFGLGTELNGSVLCRVACGNKTLRTWCWTLLL